MKITLSEKYTTRDGRAVRLLCVDAAGDDPIVGMVSDVVYRWYSDGGYQRCGASHQYDLIPLPREHRITGWLNCYRNEISGEVWGWFHTERTDADADKHRDRIACLQIDQTFLEGCGLGEAI